MGGAREFLKRSELTRFARAGWLARGLLFVLIGVLAIQVGLGVGIAANDPNALGAIAAVAEQPFGRVVLIALGPGFFLYAAWRAVSALLPGDGGPGSGMRRVGWLASAAVYATLGAATFSILLSGGGGDQSATPVLHDLMRHGWGRAVVGLVGLAILTVGFAFARHGATSGFTHEIDVDAVPDRWRTPVTWLGAAGWMGRAGVVALVGTFLVIAAVTYDVDAAQGLDGALRDLASATWGGIVVIVSGAGLVAFGLFCAATFPYRRLRAP